MDPFRDDADPDELARRARLADAVRDRHRSAARAARRLEDLTVASALLGALDREVVVHTTAGAEPLRGVVLAVGDDVVELSEPTRRWWLALAEITVVGADEHTPGDPADRSTTSLADLLADLVDSDLPVTTLLRGGGRVHGTVIALGESLTLRQQQPPRHLLVALDHLVGVAGPAPRSRP
jgi:hypothetical protein